MKMLYNINQIEHSIDKQVLWLERSLEPREPLLVIGLLNGAYKYTSDITVRIKNNPIVVDFMRVESYDGKEKKKMNITAYPKTKFTGIPILLLDDIYDSGETIEKVEEYLVDHLKPRVHFTMTAFYKQFNDHHPRFAPYRNLGLPIALEDFAVGYGMDNKEFDRNFAGVYSI